MRQNSSRNPGRSDIDLGLERRGTMRDLTDEQRVAFVVVAELMAGCDRAAAAISRDRDRRAQVKAVPADGRPPLKAGTDRPILVSLPGDAATEFDPEQSWWNDVRRICERHDSAYLSSPGRLIQEALQRAHQRHGS